MLTTTGRRNAVAFFLLGMLNNDVCRQQRGGLRYPQQRHRRRLPGQYNAGVVLKLTAPFWWRLSSYRAKIIFAGLCMCASHLLVLLPGLPVEIRLLGVALGDLGGGLGEATHLALSQHFTNPSIQISAWSSGTGMAGVVGYLLAMYALHPPGLSPHGQLVVQLSIGVGIFLTYWLCFFCLLVRPRDGAASSVSTTLGRSAAAVTASGTVNMGGSVVGTRPLLADMSDEGDALPVDDLSAWSSESTLPPVAPPTASHSSSAALRNSATSYACSYTCCATSARSLSSIGPSTPRRAARGPPSPCQPPRCTPTWHGREPMTRSTSHTRWACSSRARAASSAGCGSQCCGR